MRALIFVKCRSQPHIAVSRFLCPEFCSLIASAANMPRMLVGWNETLEVTAVLSLTRMMVSSLMAYVFSDSDERFDLDFLFPFCHF